MAQMKSRPRDLFMAFCHLSNLRSLRIKGLSAFFGIARARDHLAVDGALQRLPCFRGKRAGNRGDRGRFS